MLHGPTEYSQGVEYYYDANNEDVCWGEKERKKEHCSLRHVRGHVHQYMAMFVRWVYLGWAFTSTKSQKLGS